jgi:5-methylthioadenosine/S-adenosylhomocysteine deaminase
MNDAADIFEIGDVLIEDDRIAAVAPAGVLPKGDARVIDGTGKAVLPGLVNAHTHAAMTLLRGYADDLPLQEWLETKIWPRESFLKEGDVYDGTMLAAAEMIKGGTTFFADMYFNVDETAAAVMDSGLRASICHPIIGFRPSVKEDIAVSVAFAEKWQGGERVSAMFGPHSLYTCGAEVLAEIAEQARRLNTGIHIHFLETESERLEIEKFCGRTPFHAMTESGLLDLPVMAVHAVWLSDREMSIVSGKDFHAVHCPGSNLKLASGIAPVPAYISHDINVGLGTDGAASNNNLDMIEEARLAALVNKVKTKNATAISAYEALFMATRGGAAAAGFADSIGQITPGYKADLFLMDLEAPHMRPQHNLIANIIYSASAADVTDTIVDGRVLMQDREIIAFDQKAILAKASQTAADLVNRK